MENTKAIKSARISAKRNYAIALKKLSRITEIDSTDENLLEQMQAVGGAIKNLQAAWASMEELRIAKGGIKVYKAKFHVFKEPK